LPHNWSSFPKACRAPGVTRRESPRIWRITKPGAIAAKPAGKVDDSRRERTGKVLDELEHEMSGELAKNVRIER